MEEERELSGGNKVLPASNPRLMIAKPSGAIIGQFRKTPKEPKFMRPTDFEDFLKQLDLVIDMKLKDLAGNPITYKHAIKKSKDLALNTKIPLEEQIEFLEFQTDVLQKLENLLAALENHNGFKTYIQQLLDKPEDSGLFLKAPQGES